jgi:Zn-dependent peptidase ImmA (M78 family)/transcriptional regulator with XRE-family HTH domain
MKLSTSGFVGAHLRKARQIRGMTAMALADGLGLTKQAISNYETGRQSPSPDVADRIVDLLNLPMEFFLDKGSHKRDVSPRFWRSMAAATKVAREKAESKSEKLIDLTEVVESLIEIPLPNFPDLEPPSDPNRISDEFIENASIEVRKFWGLGIGPISNVVWLLENNGALIVRRPLEAATLDAFSNWVDQRPYVILTSEKASAVRSRFSLAHELGHLVLHRNVPESYIKDPGCFKLMENQANRFGGAFLFPQDSFVREIVNCNLEAFRLLKRRWKVSIAMMLKRCQDLEMISEKKAVLMWRYYTKNGWRIQEPFDDLIEVEQPYLLKEAIEVMLNEGILSASDLVSTIRMYSKDVEDIAGLPDGFLNPKENNLLKLKPRLALPVSESLDEKSGEILEFRSRNRERTGFSENASEQPIDPESELALVQKTLTLPSRLIN